jgi:hypothetical protein
LVNIHTLDEAIQAALEVKSSKPLGAASLVGFEEVKTLVVNIRSHPFGIVSSIDTVACKNVRIKGMVVLNGHIVKVVNIILICSPVVIHLSIRGSSLHGTTAHVGKELLAAVLPVTEKVVFLIGINSHPGRIVPSMSTVILGEVGEVVIVHGERTAMPGFILGLGVHSLHVGGTICLVWVPLLAAILIP